MAEEPDESAVLKRAMAIATAPAKQILMNGFMLYMIGSGMNMFAIFAVFYIVSNPVRAILNVNQGEAECLKLLT